jgi:hypothetical protein
MVGGSRTNAAAREPPTRPWHDAHIAMQRPRKASRRHRDTLLRDGLGPITSRNPPRSSLSELKTDAGRLFTPRHRMHAEPLGG